MSSDKTIILYDGVCGLCNRFVHFLIRRDKRDQLRFTSLQSDFGQVIVIRHGGDPAILSSVYFVRDFDTESESVLTRGKAALHALNTLGGIWRIPGVMRHLPAFLLNPGYALVAKLRYRIWGKLDACPMPSPELARKFIL